MSCEEWLETSEATLDAHGAPVCPEHGELVGSIPPGPKPAKPGECAFPTKKAMDKAIERGIVDA